MSLALMGLSIADALEVVDKFGDDLDYFMEGFRLMYEKKRALAKLDQLEVMIALENGKSKKGQSALKKWQKRQGDILEKGLEKKEKTIFEKRREAMTVFQRLQHG